MFVRRARINCYLLLPLVLTFLSACKTNSNNPEKQLALLRIHLEATSDGTPFTQSVEVVRAHPVLLNVDKTPILTEADVSEAKLLDVPGGFVMQIQFDRHGTFALEQYSTANLSRHIAIFSEFGNKPVQTRWLAAPLFTRPVHNGVLTFTPDANLHEAEEIVRGLNNVAAEIRKKSR